MKSICKDNLLIEAKYVAKRGLQMMEDEEKDPFEGLGWEKEIV